MTFPVSSVVAINSIATCARIHWLKRFIFISAAATLMSGCALPDKPERAVMYDFGPGPVSTQPSTRLAPLPPLAIDEVSTSGGAIDNMAVLYRLGYADVQQLRPYAHARWTMPPSQLVRQRLLSRLGERRAVFNAGSSVALSRVRGSGLPLRLRVELEEFSQLFTSPTASAGLIRLRATLVDITPAGEKLLAQRSVVVQQPATSADAPGGVRALTEATDAAIQELDQWLQQAAAAEKTAAPATQ